MFPLRCNVQQCPHSDLPAPTALSPSLDQTGLSTALCATYVVAAASLLLYAPDAMASEGVMPLDLFLRFIGEVEALGSLGGLFFVMTVIVAEMIPLFPTQPLSLSAGLLFGPLKGAGLVLAGNIGAATAAYLLARGVGRPLAEKLINAEMSGDKESSIISDVQDTIQNGSTWAQFVSIMFLRFTPLVPFSASNYVLGLSPLSFLPFFGGTVVGMAPWALLFASVGAAGRSLLEGGEDFGQVISELGEQASTYTEEAVAVGAVVAVVAGLGWAVRRQMGQSGSADEGEGKREEAPPAPAVKQDKDSVRETL
mmetsp:Transcript_35354/g.100086  ORF Transcript_35354/g.100086 Transcript_35354/m.100086 type:complete len:310 (+) Transcript_35354:789-1718(+)